jgi:hypothetical protein
MGRFLTTLFLASVFIQPAAAASGTNSVREACHDDLRTLCPDVEHGGGRSRTCLKEHLDKVSAACQAALEAK